MPLNISGSLINSSDIKVLGTTNIIQRGLNLYLDASNTASYAGSGTSWYDLSGNVNNGVLTNGPTYDSNNGGSITLDGVNDNIIIPAKSIPTGTQITFCVWNYGYVRQSSSIIEARDSTGNRTINVHLTWGDGNIYFDCGGDRLYQYASDSDFYGWRYWCFTKNTTTGMMGIYRNGILWASSTGNVGTIVTTTTVRIGSYAIDTTFHPGKVGNVKIYNRELSSSEILQNYNIQKARFGL